MNARSDRRRRSVVQVFAMPLLIGLATIAGLVIGLTGDGAHDLLSWVLLLPPIAAIAWAWARRA